MVYAAKNYTHAQLIAYEVPTLNSTAPGNPPTRCSDFPFPSSTTRIACRGSVAWPAW